MKDMNIPVWASVSTCFVLIILALISLSTPLGIILITGIMGTAIGIALFFMENRRKDGGHQ
jgi:hypothetical protein